MVVCRCLDAKLIESRGIEEELEGRDVQDIRVQVSPPSYIYPGTVGCLITTTLPLLSYICPRGIALGTPWLTDNREVILGGSRRFRQSKWNSVRSRGSNQDGLCTTPSQCHHAWKARGQQIVSSLESCTMILYILSNASITATITLPVHVEPCLMTMPCSCLDVHIDKP